jgi:hypothetical protein
MTVRSWLRQARIRPCDGTLIGRGNTVTDSTVAALGLS